MLNIFPIHFLAHFRPSPDKAICKIRSKNSSSLQRIQKPTSLHFIIATLLAQISKVDTVVPNLPEQHRKYFIQREAQRIRAEKVRNCSLNFSIIETLYPMHHSVYEVR